MRPEKKAAVAGCSGLEQPCLQETVPAFAGRIHAWISQDDVVRQLNGEDAPCVPEIACDADVG
jgi:hypothetical protein